MKIEYDGNYKLYFYDTNREITLNEQEFEKIKEVFGGNFSELEQTIEDLLEKIDELNDEIIKLTAQLIDEIAKNQS